MPESLKWDGEKYDCKPGLAGWKKFKELLVTNSARADKAGFSLLQNLLRDDEGARDAANENPQVRRERSCVSRSGNRVTIEYVLAEAHVPLEAAVSVRRQPGTGSNSYVVTTYTPRKDT